MYFVFWVIPEACQNLLVPARALDLSGLCFVLDGEVDYLGGRTLLPNVSQCVGCMRRGLRGTAYSSV